MGQAFAQFENLPAPMQGIDAITGLMEMQPTECIYALNFIMTSNGPTVRPGWNEWCTNLTGTGGVRTVIPVRGGGTAGAQDFLFAVTATGIWACTAASAAPTQVVAFGTTTGNAGYCEWDISNNAGGDVTLLVCDEVNGYYTFDTATSTWTKVTMGTGAAQVSGIDPATFASVRVFENRVWFVQAGTGFSWYLPAGNAIYGAATAFSWGNKFPHGGNLTNLYIFTYGSALGTYIYLIGISDAGDILAYQGADPNSASTWTLSGQWYVGDMPAGRRSASNYGGDLNILCAYGIIQLSSLFVQKDQADPKIYLSEKIAPALAADFSLTSTIRGWSFISWPSQNSLIITEPIITGTTKKQYCYNLATNSWSIFNSLDWQHAGFWHGNLYAGTSDGRVIKMIGNADSVKLDGTGGIAINFGILGAFQQGKTPAVQKIVDLIRAYFITSSQVSYQTAIAYDFNLNAFMLGSVPYMGGSTTPGATGWDSGIWDSAIWDAGGSGVAAGAQIPQISNQGAQGIGRWYAVACFGATEGFTTLTGYELSYRPTESFF